MQPKVSVIVPVYKVDKYLTQCLDSIVNQTLKDIEIIVIDEGDKDRCREIIDFFVSKDSRIIAPHKKNGGYGASCNYGFEIAKGEYIIIVESDDWIDSYMCEEMYAYAKRLDADVVKSPYLEYFSDGIKRDCRYRKYMADVTPQDMCFSMKEFGEMLEIHASLWSGIYKTDYIRKNEIQFIKAKGGAYVDVGFRIDTLIHSNKIAWLDKPYYNYRVDAVGSTTNNFKLSPMIQRWREAHEKFVLIQDDYDKYYGRHLVYDEFLNTIGWIDKMNISLKQVREMSRNFDFVKESVVFDSKILSKNNKWKIIFFKKHPALYWFLFSNIKKMRKIRNSFFMLLNFVTKPIVLFVLFMMYFLSLTNNPLLGKSQERITLIFSCGIVLYFILAVFSLLCKKINLVFFRKLKEWLYKKYD